MKTKMTRRPTRAKKPSPKVAALAAHAEYLAALATAPEALRAWERLTDASAPALEQLDAYEALERIEARRPDLARLRASMFRAVDVARAA